jgi:tetratricopeptide (TPR) repeat protein
MAYNKSKFVESAQKLLNQGKVSQAIAEYQQILKHEPRDQVTLMTVGELYIRQGETFQAIDYFERLAQIFVGDGFLTKAIAVYKRIAKLAPEEIRPLEKLADLYVQQGVMSEARPLFLQLAEIHLKNNRQPEAVALLKKLLTAEPDNLRIQIRLADLYQAMGQAKEALEAYIGAAQRALARGDQAECERLVEKAMKIEPGNLSAVTLKARMHAALGHFAQASQTLADVAGLEKGGEQAELLLDLYLKESKWDQATELALRVFDLDPKNFSLVQKLVEALLDADHGERAMAILDHTRIPMIDTGEHELIARLLNGLAERMPRRLEPLEWLVETYGRTSDSFRLPDALAHLGDALVAANQMDRAKQVFEQLVEREPESDPARRKLDDVLRRMGLLETPAAGIPVPEAHAPAELAMPPAPKVRPDFVPAAKEVVAVPAARSGEPPLDDDTQKFIAQSLTDVDLFASYGLTQKAIGLLEAILRRAPRHTPTLEKLLDFVLGGGDDRRTAELAAQLALIHSERGDTRSAERFGELRRRFQRAAGLTDEELTGSTEAVSNAAAELALPEIAAEAEIAEPVLGSETEQLAVQSMDFPIELEVPQAEPVGDHAPAARVEAAEVHEVDLSNEWAALSEETTEDGSPEIASEAEHGDGPAVTSEATPEFAIPGEHVEPLSLEEFSTAEAPNAVPSEPDSSASPEFELPIQGTEGEQEPVLEMAETPTSAAPGAEPVAPLAFPELIEEPAAILEQMPAQLPEPALEVSEPVAETHVSAEEIPEVRTEAIEPAVAESPVEVPAELANSEPTGEVPAVPAEPESEFELEQDYELVLDPEALVPAHDQRPPETPIVAQEMEGQGETTPPVEIKPGPEIEQVLESFAGLSGVPGLPASGVPGPNKKFATDQFLSELASEIQEMGIGDFTPAFSDADVHAAPAESSDRAKAAGPGVPSGPLTELFDEFRAELGEMGADEDLETHYNLGIAFREMGLLEEAISEFQKVAQAMDRGRKFRYAMQCCTLLGLAFMEKNQPSVAAIWYERALLAPGLDNESTLALRYDLGVAQEMAGEVEDALKNFFQVYAANIDYRDVGERITALQKPAR